MAQSNSDSDEDALAQSGAIPKNQIKASAEFFDGKFKFLGSFTPSGVWAGAAGIAMALGVLAILGNVAAQPEQRALFWIGTFLLGVTCGLGVASGEMKRLVEEVLARRKEIEDMAGRKADLEKVVLEHARLTSKKKNN